jgi:hypothetical protein
MTHRERIEQYIREGRSVSGGKDDQAKNNANQAAQTANNAAQQQNTFNSQLMNIFNQQFQNQQGVLNFLKGKMTAGVNNPQGYTPAQLTSMRTGATDATALQYQNAQKALQNNPAMGSAGLPSGVRAQNEANLQGQEANAQAGAQEQITAQNANLQQTNYWNSVNALNGVAAQQNPLGYSGAATSGTDAVNGASGAESGASNAETNAYNSGNSWMGVLGGIAGGAGTALGGYLGNPNH